MKLNGIEWVSESHSKGVWEIYKPIIESTAISFELDVPTLEEMESRILRIADEFPWIVMMREGVVAGYAYASNFRTRAAYRFTQETTVYVNKDFRNQGIATQLYNQLIEILHYQGVQQLMAVITIPNDESIQFHEKLGFHESGKLKRVGVKFNQHWDVALYQRQLTQESEKELLNLNEVKDYFTF